MGGTVACDDPLDLDVRVLVPSAGQPLSQQLLLVDLVLLAKQLGPTRYARQ